ncbi:MAG: DUF2062 domain-containing protein [Candidatus Omnitrophica bacterium]|nr:DUF2062 domain-containing protein [Candidatus Omnitrophota bacterium]
MKWKLKKFIVKILRMNNTPHEIALGIAIGVFIGILPVYGFHTILFLIAIATIRRVNKIAVLAGTNISLPPTVPIITWTAYDIGRIVFWGKYDPLTWSDFKNISFASIRSRYLPLFVGSLILGALCAVFFYYLVYFVTKRIMKKRADAKREHHERKKV